MNNDKQNNSVYKILLAGLLGMLSTGLFLWVTTGRHAVTRADVVHMIQTESPYVQDRNMFVLMQDDIKEIKKTVSEVRTDVEVIKLKVGTKKHGRL